MTYIIDALPETVHLTTCHCGGCGLYWAVDSRWDQDRRNDGKTFWCPNGCRRAYHRTESIRLREEKEKLERQLANTHESLRSARAANEVERRRHAATKGQLTKTRKRAAAALCPVQGCQRSFVQMERHIKSKHPGWTPEPQVAE